MSQEENAPPLKNFEETAKVSGNTPEDRRQLLKPQPGDQWVYAEGRYSANLSAFKRFYEAVNGRQ